MLARFIRNLVSPPNKDAKKDKTKEDSTKEEKKQDSRDDALLWIN